MAIQSSVPIPSIDAFGFQMPTYDAVLAAHQADYRGIYGSDTYLGSDSQDGEWTAIEATVIYDTFAVALSVYNAFSPATAQGTGLSSVVKTNGIARLLPSNSTVDIVNVGVFATVVTFGQVRDTDGQIWQMPTFTIPASGTITVTATCLLMGAIAAPIGTVWTIANPTRGWQSVSNITAATPGQPLESDPELRVRQAQSTMLPSVGVLDGMLGEIAAITGVARYRGYENDGDVIDANGLPGHTISLVVDGGDDTLIATAIARRKNAAGTYGSTMVSLTSAEGITRNITFFRPTEPQITYNFVLKGSAGFTIDYQTQIAQAVSDWTNALGIGDGTLGAIDLGRVYGPALLIGTAAAATFKILSITMARDGGVLGTADVPILFNEAPICSLGNITFTVT